MKSLVSIIIPTYNRALLIGETLDSIIAQTYINWECIIVDDGSTDDTIDLVKKYCEKDTRIQYYHRPKNRIKGANACRNYGYELSKGDYIQWFDSDDLMHPRMLEIKARQLSGSNVDFVVCEGVEYKDEINNVIREWNEIFSENVFKDHIIGKVNFHTNGPMFKRAFLEDKKLFNEKLKRKQEWEFYSRLLSYSVNYKPIFKKLYYFRSHANSINGFNSISTLESRVLSNRLVYEIVKKCFKGNELELLKKHFLYKYIDLLKITIKSKKIKLIIVSSYAIIYHLSVVDIVRGIKKIIHKPYIIKNLFYK